MEKNKYNPESRGAGKYWLTLGIFVLAVDTLNKETLTNAFARGREHERFLVRAATVGAAVITFAHLMDWIPEKTDPIDNIAKGLGKISTAFLKQTPEGSSSEHIDSETVKYTSFRRLFNTSHLRTNSGSLTP